MMVYRRHHTWTKRREPEQSVHRLLKQQNLISITDDAHSAVIHSQYTTFHVSLSHPLCERDSFQHLVRGCAPSFGIRNTTYAQVRALCVCVFQKFQSDIVYNTRQKCLFTDSYSEARYLINSRFACCEQFKQKLFRSAVFSSGVFDISRTLRSPNSTGWEWVGGCGSFSLCGCKRVKAFFGAH